MPYPRSFLLRYTRMDRFTVRVIRLASRMNLLRLSVSVLPKTRNEGYLPSGSNDL